MLSLHWWLPRLSSGTLTLLPGAKVFPWCLQPQGFWSNWGCTFTSASPGLSSGRRQSCHKVPGVSGSPGPLHAFNTSTMWETLTRYLPGSAGSFACRLVPSQWTTASVCWPWGNSPRRLHPRGARLLLITADSSAPLGQSKGFTSVAWISCQSQLDIQLQPFINQRVFNQMYHANSHDSIFERLWTSPWNFSSHASIFCISVNDFNFQPPPEHLLSPEHPEAFWAHSSSLSPPPKQH